MADEAGTVVMRDVRLVFRNFRGEETKFNQEGAKNFGVILPPDIAEMMQADGWNVKTLNPREDELEENPEMEGTPWIQVKVGFNTKGRPPKIYLVTSRGRTLLTEKTVNDLDFSDIVKTDLIVRPYHYDVNGRQGISAYVQSMYVTIEEDELEREYAMMDAQGEDDNQ